MLETDLCIHCSLQDDITVKHCTNAYMLVYIRDSEMSEYIQGAAITLRTAAYKLLLINKFCMYSRTRNFEVPGEIKKGFRLCAVLK